MCILPIVLLFLHDIIALSRENEGEINKMIEKRQINIKDYFIMYNKLIKEKITVTEWNLYCMEILNNLMIENKEILKNLKN